MPPMSLASWEMPTGPKESRPMETMPPVQEHPGIIRTPPTDERPSAAALKRGQLVSRTHLRCLFTGAETQVRLASFRSGVHERRAIPQHQLQRDRGMQQEEMLSAQEGYRVAQQWNNKRTMATCGTSCTQKSDDTSTRAFASSSASRAAPAKRMYIISLTVVGHSDSSRWEERCCSLTILRRLERLDEPSRYRPISFLWGNVTFNE